MVIFISDLKHRQIAFKSESMAEHSWLFDQILTLTRDLNKSPYVAAVNWEIEK